MARHRVLVQFAGTRRNRREVGPTRPGLVLATKPIARDPVDAVVVLADQSEEGSDVARHLVGDIRSARRRGPDEKGGACDLIVLDARLASEPGARRSLAQRLAERSGTVSGRKGDRRIALVPWLHERFPRAKWEALVSLESGAATDIVGMAELLEDEGFAVSFAALDRATPTQPWHLCAPRVADTVESLKRCPSRLAQLYARLPASSSVLIVGETGSGKSQLARELHEAWKNVPGRPAREGALRTVNCAAIPEALLESELFGHDKGAFTGATGRREGEFVAAKDGTLFLDEIGEMPRALQAKLLLVLSEVDKKGARTIRRVGGGTATTDARLIFATNQDLAQHVIEQRFRDDLHARIATHVIELSPLRERRHRILGAYLAELEQLAEPYDARFVLVHPALRRLHEFAQSPESLWRWNFRDVSQSADRLAFRATTRRPPKTAGGDVLIELGDVEDELAELRARWAESAPTAEAAPDPWRDLREALEPGQLEAMSALERWEARYLFEARRATDSQAAAWKLIREQNLLALSDERAPSNPSDAFKKRWRRFRWR